MTDRKPRKPSIKKTGKRSPHFPPPPKGPAKSSYFTVRRRSAGGRRGVGGAKSAAIINWKGNEGDSGSCGSFADVIVITEQSFLEGMAGCRDGWMTEAESKHDKEARRERREKQKGRKFRVNKRKKLNGELRGVKAGIGGSVVTMPDGSGAQRLGEENKGCVQNPVSEGDFRDPGLAVIIECRKSSPNTSEINAGKVDIKRDTSERRKRKREKRRRVRSERMSIPVEQTEQSPRHSKKRKRSTTLETHITSSGLPPDTILGIPDTQPEKGHRKIGGNGRAWARTENECLPAGEDTLEARILRYWAKKYPGTIDVCEDMGISADKSPPKTITSPSQVIRQEDIGSKLQALDMNTWPRAAVSNGGTPSSKPQNTVTPLSLPRATPQNPSAQNGKQFSSKKVTPILPPNIPRSTLPSSSPTAEAYVSPIEELDTVSNPISKTSAVTPRKRTKRKIKKTEIVSRYFASSATEPPPPRKKSQKNRVTAGTSVIPWPPLTAENFGLIQEELRDNMFHLVIAAMFLNKIRGSIAIPLLRQFLVDYPTPQALSQGDYDTIKNFLWPLGLQRIRAKRLIEMAKIWIANPPTPGRGFKKYNYPARDTKPFNFPEPPGGDPEAGERPKLGVEQGCEWEIAHLPGVGAYAIDSWRIFCRDDFRKGMIDEGGNKGQMEEEWRRVVPKDKELRACLRWRWAKEGLRWREVGDMEVEVGGGVKCEVQVQEQTEVGEIDNWGNMNHSCDSTELNIE